jgi:CoA-transferase family III
MPLLEAIAEEARGLPFAIDPADLLRRDRELSPPGLWSPNRHCRMIEAADGWLAVNLARADDRAAIPAWLQSEVRGDVWDAVIDGVRHQPANALLDQAILLGLPVSIVGEVSPLAPPPAATIVASSLSNRKVIDLSALWAGPLCGALLAKAGMDVTKIESLKRPDPTGDDARLNGAKQRVTIDLSAPALSDAIADADILITSGRPHALARLGLTPDALFARNPRLIWVAITAYGFTGPAAMRIGFGDDAAAAGGLVRWQDGAPHFMGDALADPLTGLRAARLAMEHVAQDKAGLIDVALAQTAASYSRGR